MSCCTKLYISLYNVVHIIVIDNDEVSWSTPAFQPAETAKQPFSQANSARSHSDGLLISS